MRICLALAFSMLVVGATSSIGCSDPVPLIPRGAWSLTFQDTGSECTVAGHNAAVGQVEADGELELKANGTDDAEVSCEVKTAGGGYAVSGKVRFKGQYLSLNVAEVKKDATFEEPATGHVEFQTGQTAKIYRSDECIIYFVDDQLVDKGKVWGSFQCAAVQGPNDSICAVQQGYFAFENCVGSETEEGA